MVAGPEGSRVQHRARVVRAPRANQQRDLNPVDDSGEGNNDSNTRRTENRGGIFDVLARRQQQPTAIMTRMHASRWCNLN